MFSKKILFVIADDQSKNTQYKVARFQKSAFCKGLYILFLSIIYSSVNAVAIAPGNLLISSQNTVYEYTTSGVQLQSFTTEYPGGYAGHERARDIAVGVNNNVHIYNGTFSPFMSTRNMISDEWTHTTKFGFDTVDGGSYGGIDVFGSTVFVTDMTLFTGIPQGVVAFDINTGVSTRFAESLSPTDLTLGLDGLLYVKNSELEFVIENNDPFIFETISIYDPSTFAFLNSVRIDIANDGNHDIAVDKNKNIFIARSDGSINHYDPSGNLVNSITPECNQAGTFHQCYFYDIDISTNGQLALGTRDGEILMTDTSLTNTTSFYVGDRPVFVEFSPVPIPAAIWLFGSGLLGLIGVSKHKTV